MDLQKAKKTLSGTLVFGDEEQIAAHKYWEEVEECIAAIKSCPHEDYEVSFFYGDKVIRHKDCKCFDRFSDEGLIRDAFAEFEERERKNGLK